MKKLKIDYLFLAAVILSSGAAIATNGPKGPQNSEGIYWERVAPNGLEEGSWREGSDASQCGASNKICKARFEEGYDPNEHTQTENQSAALSGSLQTGFVEQ